MSTKCNASGRIFTNYGGPRPDAEGRIPCPECGKQVMLKREMSYPWSGRRVRIPAHQPAPKAPA